MSFLLRVVLPDRPGALGAVASALGTVGADILSVDVIERGPGRATDDFVVEVPPDRLADSLVSAAASVPGVTVESIRPYAGQLDPHRELELLESLARAADDAHDAVDVFADGVARVFRAGWVLVLGRPGEDGTAPVLARGGAAPELPALPAPWWPPQPSRRLEPDDSWAPADWGRTGAELAVTALGAAALLVGRPLRWADAELVRLQHLAAIAASVSAVQEAAAGPRDAPAIGR